LLWKFDRRRLPTQWLRNHPARARNSGQPLRPPPARLRRRSDGVERRLVRASILHRIRPLNDGVSARDDQTRNLRDRARSR
jgi:hypothetical protein